MTDIQKKILIAGIKIKLARGEELEDILISYVKLNETEKQEIRGALITA
ncbi:MULTISPECIES: hypothetical protein [unclassified Sedimentibacter]|nr:hypothetical protein [Sedimentibacter sp. MB35-C1]WMJ78516.1 hypothetical protein RBQ61_06230 [Sedimentibacter sp. MB35-C1]